MRAEAQAIVDNLKQSLDLEPYFDFVVNEQCGQYSECYWYGPFVAANKAVLQAEYKKQLSNYCPDADGKRIPIADPMSAQQLEALEANAPAFGIRYIDYADVVAALFEQAPSTRREIILGNNLAQSLRIISMSSRERPADIAGRREKAKGRVRKP